MSQILRQAETTRALGGRRIRAVDSRLIAGLLTVEILGAMALTAGSGAHILLVIAAPVALVVLQLVTLSLWWSRGVRANNDGVEALSLGRFGDAEDGFRVLVTRRYPRSLTALGLQNLATVAIQRGELADGARLARAAMEILSRTQPRTTAEAFSGHIRANYAFALLANGEVDEAEAVLRAAAEPGALAKSEALLVRARALALVRRERWEDAALLLESERRLLRNALTGAEAVLAEVLEAFALHRLGGVVAGKPQPIPLVPVDDDERAFVTRILPGSEVVLTAAS